ncbi:MAG: sugar transferase [Acidobacteriota bacterium]|nr:sugar transferase [Acidobacteriota bacterium]
MFRRFTDIAVSAIALLLLCPLFVLIAAAIKLDSRGPVFYRGERAGVGGRRFRMWKFRTMRVGSDTAGSITGRGDSRVTPLGRLLRRTKLDELPQVINVLMGDMTLVGPRPESPDIVEIYDPAQKRVLDVKPGVTGWVQLTVEEESDTFPEGVDPRAYYIEHVMDRKIQLDLRYQGVRSMWTDTWIVIRTAGRVARTVIRL